MSEITEKIKQELLIRCEKSKEKDGYDFWNDHIKYVVKNALQLANQYGADVEIVELGALLHDIAMPSEYGEREQHHIYGAEIAEQLLTELNYPKERIEKVKECVLNHRGSKDRPRNTIEEQCVADADVIAHFDCIPSLFSLVYKEMGLSIEDGKEYVRKKLERDYNKLSVRTREILKDRYENIIKVIFVNKEKIYKEKNRILITGAVLGYDNSLVDTYEKIISLMDSSKHVVSSPLDTMKFKGNDVERYERAMKLLQDTKIIIAEMSSISTGQGMELQEAVKLNIPILVIAKENSKISGLVKGCKNVKDIIYYNEIEDIEDKIVKFIREEE